MYKHDKFLPSDKLSEESKKSKTAKQQKKNNSSQKKEKTKKNVAPDDDAFDRCSKMKYGHHDASDAQRVSLE